VIVEKVSADTILMIRNTLTLVAFAAICPGQSPQVEQQWRQNATTVTVQPGTVGSIRFVLQPRTQGSDEILIGAPDKTLGLSLRLPNGALVDSNSAASVGLRWETKHGAWVLGLCEAAESWVMITLPPGAQGGQYTLEGKLPESAQPARLCATAFTMGGLKGVEDTVGGGDWVQTDHGIYQVGDPVRISLAVMDGGQAVHGAKVEAVILSGDINLPKTEVGRLQLNDARANEGYVGIFQPLDPGYYKIQVTISGRKGIQTARFSVYPAAGTLLSGEFANADGQLRVVMRFRISFGGEYRIQPTFSCGGRTTNYQTVRNLVPGEEEVVTDITPQQLKQLNLFPPCELVGIHVVRKNPAAQSGYDLVGWWFNKNGQWLPR
jgi:hypothetical protein